MLVLVIVSDLEVPELFPSVIDYSQFSSGMNGPPHWPDNCSYSIELFITYGAVETDPRRVSRLGGTKFKIAGTFVVCSILSVPCRKFQLSTHLNAPGRNDLSSLVLLKYRSLFN